MTGAGDTETFLLSPQKKERMRRMKRSWKMIWHIPRLLQQAWQLLRDPKVAGSSKLLLILVGFGYLLWPLDFIPDVPLLGHLDDLGLIFLLLNWFVNRSMPDDTDYVEADYYFKDEDKNE